MKVIEQSATLLTPSTPEEAVRQLKLVEYAARTCYMSRDKITDESFEKFLQSLIRRGHTAPLEFGYAAFHLVTSRDVLAELTRHRLANFCVQSQRYVLGIDAEGDDISFIRPDFHVDAQGDKTDAYRWCAAREWENQMKDAENSFKDLVRKYHMVPQDARKVLPNSTSCEIIMGANIREWRHILSLRTAPAAYPEMRTLMKKISDELLHVYPAFLFEDVIYKEETNDK